MDRVPESASGSLDLSPPGPGRGFLEKTAGLLWEGFRNSTTIEVLNVDACWFLQNLKPIKPKASHSANEPESCLNLPQLFCCPVDAVPSCPRTLHPRKHCHDLSFLLKTFNNMFFPKVCCKALQQHHCPLPWFSEQTWTRTTQKSNRNYIFVNPEALWKGLGGSFPAIGETVGSPAETMRFHPRFWSSATVLGNGYGSLSLKLWGRNILKPTLFFPTCQVRVVGFYHSCSPPPPRLAILLLLLLLLLRQHLLHHLCLHSTSIVALPTLRQAIRQRPSSVGTAGPQPGTFPAQCAPLDLNLGPSQLSAHRWTSAAR